MGAAEHIAGGSCHALRTQYCHGSRPRMRLEYEAVQVNQEGSLRWRRQRKQAQTRYCVLDDQFPVTEGV